MAIRLFLPHGHYPMALAYIGPGAGFAFLGSFLSILAGFFLTLLSFVAWPFRLAWRVLRRNRGYRKARVHKVIFLGLDGLDPRLTERYMEGRGSSQSLPFAP